MDRFELIGQKRVRALVLSMAETIGDICDEYKIHQCDKDSASGWSPFLGWWAINDPDDE